MTENPRLPRPKLRRTIGLTALVLYGLGTTVGAGIYALLGEVTAVAGALTPYAFLLAGLLAAGTALSFAEFVQRYPTAGAAAAFVSHGFGSPMIGRLTGLLIILAGLVSAAALLNASVGYLQTLVNASARFLVLVELGLLTAVCVWGISQSVWLAGTICVLEIGGLLWMATLALLDPAPALTAGSISSQSAAAFGHSPVGAGGLVLSGAVLAFYAYIGFEDMVEVAEEVRNVRWTLPLAIILTLLLTTGLYLLLVLAAMRSLGVEQLASSSAPLALLAARVQGGDSLIISLIAIAAISNGALIQLVMVSRVLYGMANRGDAPGWLGRVAEHTRTPVVATLIAAASVLLLTQVADLGALARITSLLMLTVFLLVNLALINLKRRAPKKDRGWLPLWVPIGGAGASLGLVAASVLALLPLDS